jgi:hypothetical protein
MPGGSNAAFTGVETEENFTEGEEIEGHKGMKGGEKVQGCKLENRVPGGGCREGNKGWKCVGFRLR